MSLFLAATTDTLDLVTSSTAPIDVHADFMDASMADPPVVKGSTSAPQNTAITTATTTTIVSAPAASHLRNIKNVTIRNKSTTASNDVTVVHNRSGTDAELVKVTLLAGETLQFIEGVGWYKPVSNIVPTQNNESTAQQGSGFSSDTYLTGSFVKFGPGSPVVGTKYRLTFDVSKTAAGTATPILTIRVGTAGTTSDTGRLTFTWGAGSAAADIGFVEVAVVFRTVGSGTAATIIGRACMTNNLASTGLTSAVKTVVPSVSAGFDSTTTDLGIGASWNGGTSAAHTVQLVTAEVTA